MKTEAYINKTAERKSDEGSFQKEAPTIEVKKLNSSKNFDPSRLSLLKWSGITLLILLFAQVISINLKNPTPLYKGDQQMCKYCEKTANGSIPSKKEIKRHKKALAKARKAGNRRRQESLLFTLGFAYSDLGLDEVAIGYFEEGLDLARKTGKGEHMWLGYLGFTYTNLGQNQKAVDIHEQALILSRKTGNRTHEGASLVNLAFAYQNLGRRGDALEVKRQALSICDVIESPEADMFKEVLTNI